MNIIVIVLAIAIAIFLFLNFNKKETFIDSVQVLPQYKNTTPQQMADFFGGADQLTTILIKYNIPKDTIKNPKMYPQIASYIHQQSKESQP